MKLRHGRLPRGMLLMILAVSACGPKVMYAPGTAPPLMCRGENAEWNLGWRESVNSFRWTIVAEFKWSQWVDGRSLRTDYGLVTSRISNFGPSGLMLYLEDAAGRQVSAPAFLHAERDCVYMDGTRTLVLYARHARL